MYFNDNNNNQQRPILPHNKLLGQWAITRIQGASIFYFIETEKVGSAALCVNPALHWCPRVRPNYSM